MDECKRIEKLAGDIQLEAAGGADPLRIGELADRIGAITDDLASDLEDDDGGNQDDLGFDGEDDDEE